MKNLNSILNIVLAAAVALLYYFHFSGGKAEPVADVPSDSTAHATHKMVAEAPREIKASKIVYVNADTLFDNYELVKELKKEAEGKQSRIETAYKAKAGQLQKDYMAFQQKVQAGMVSQDDGKKAEEEFMRRKEDLDGMEKQLQQLAEDTQTKNDQVQKNIKDYLAEYNKSAGYQYVLAYTSAVGSVLLADESLDITKEILDGLNAQYRKDKGISNPKTK